VSAAVLCVGRVRGVLGALVISAAGVLVSVLMIFGAVGARILVRMLVLRAVGVAGAVGVGTVGTGILVRMLVFRAVLSVGITVFHD
jgi:hypothetical protein